MRPIKKRKILLANILDSIGRLLFLFHKKPSDQPIDVTKIKSILFLELFNIGDVVLALPALHELRQLCPKAKITFIGGPWSKDLLRDNKNIDEILIHTVPWVDKKSSWWSTWKLTRELKKRQFDVGIDVRGDFRNILFLYLSGAKERIASYSTQGRSLLTRVAPREDKPLHDVEHKLSAVRVLGNTKQTPVFDLSVPAANQQLVKQDFQSKGITPSDIVIGIHPGGRWYGRRWQPERFAKVINAIGSQPQVEFVVFGGPDEKEIITNIARLAKISILQIYPSLDLLPAYLQQCDLLLCNESGPMHIAAALNIPVVALFGPNLPDILGPYGPNHEIIMAPDVPCRPCAQTICTRPDLWCMDLISVEQVIQILTNKLAGLKKRTL